MTAYENSRSLQGLEVVSLAESCSDGAPSAPSSGNHIQPLYLPADRMKAFSRLSRFGMTFKPLTENLGAALLTWYREDFLARTSAAPEKGQASPENGAGCGSTWRGSLARYDHGTRSWRTHQYSLLGGLHLFSETWPRWGMMRSGECSERPMPVHLTKENASGSLLPTPSGTSNHGQNHVSGRLDEWGGSSNPFRGTEAGKLHSACFEEWMMGWPVLWTAPTPLGTDKFQQWCASHGVPFLKD